MGNCFRRPAERSETVQQSSQGPSSQGPPSPKTLQRRHQMQRLHESPAEPPLDPQILLQALSAMGTFLSTRDLEIELIAMGGETYNLLFPGKIAPYNKDFLKINLPDKKKLALYRAAQHAEAKCERHIGVDRFTRRHMLQLPEPIHQKVITLALSQKDYIFQSQGLKILAPPWDYIFCLKLNKLTLDVPLQTRKNLLLEDAAWTLHRRLSKRRNPYPSERAMVNDLIRSAEFYGIGWNAQTFDSIKHIYQTRYGSLVAADSGQLSAISEGSSRV